MPWWWIGLLAFLAFFHPSHRDRLHELSINGQSRYYLLHAPESVPAGPRPLLIALHGHGGTAARMRRTTNFNALADAHGFFTAYPEGASWRNTAWRSWNAGGCCGFARQTNVDDVAFLRALIADARERYAVDPQRIFVAGVSNGGMMAYRAACELSADIAGIAVVAGSMQSPRCEPAHPVAVMIMHGTADRLVPYGGGPGGDAEERRTDPPVASAVEFWTRHNRGRADVLLRTIEGGRHSWPAGAAEEIWVFFSRQAKSG